MASDGTNMLSGRSRPRQSMVHAMQPPRTTAPPRPGQGAKDGDATEFMTGTGFPALPPNAKKEPGFIPAKKAPSHGTALEAENDGRPQAVGTDWIVLRIRPATKYGSAAEFGRRSSR